VIKYSTKEFTFGDTVYLRTDPQQYPCVLIGVYLAPSYKADDPAVPKFVISCNGNKYKVFDFEVTKERGPVAEIDVE
jgi:hypothetical protein